MKGAIFSTNLSFFENLDKAFKRDGHELRFWKQTDAFNNGLQISELLFWADVAFIDFCQEPLQQVLHAIPIENSKVFVVARMHRLEMYNQHTLDPKFPWNKVDLLLASADHVLQRFLVNRGDNPKPKHAIVAPSNAINTFLFNWADRVWEPPYRISLVGNIVPKKRQYTAIQMMADLKSEYNSQLRLDIIGASGTLAGYGNTEYLQNCKDLVQDLALSDVVNFYEKATHESMPHFYARSHFVLSLSNEEGTHVSIAEAMSTGCIPIIGPWRGAKTIYPTAMHFAGLSGFYVFINQVVTKSLPSVKLKILSNASRTYVVKNCLDTDVNDKIITQIKLLTQGKL